MDRRFDLLGRHFLIQDIMQGDFKDYLRSYETSKKSKDADTDGLYEVIKKLDTNKLMDVWIFAFGLNDKEARQKYNKIKAIIDKATDQEKVTSIEQFKILCDKHGLVCELESERVCFAGIRFIRHQPCHHYYKGRCLLYDVKKCSDEECSMQLCIQMSVLEHVFKLNELQSGF